MNKIFKRVLKEVELHYREYEKFIKNKDKVLDIGVGVGFTAEYIQSNKRGIRIQGLDVENLLRKDLPIKIYDGLTIPFEDKSFDVSLIFYVLHHTENQERLIQEAIRVTKRNIILIEEYFIPRINMEEELKKENRTLSAIGLPTTEIVYRLSMRYVESLFKDMKLLKKVKLETKTDKKVEKYLYILEPKN